MSQTIGLQSLKSSSSSSRHCHHHHNDVFTSAHSLSPPPCLPWAPLDKEAPAMSQTDQSSEQPIIILMKMVMMILKMVMTMMMLSEIMGSSGQGSPGDESNRSVQ